MIDLIKNDWNVLLKEEFKANYFGNLQLFLKEQYSSKTIYPCKNNIFRAFNLTPYNKVKVVILGQDPYHGPNQAHGLCFSVNKNIAIPRSLNNIYKELFNSLNCPIPNHGDLSNWANQGVLLLNTVLTVEAHKANSHKNKGWEQFTTKVIELLNEKNTPIVFILWGNHARRKKVLITNNNHLVLESAHPSPLSASRGFFGNNHFKTTNDFLIEQGLKPINWCISD